ncbi:unnamed protein product [Phytomonas sp. EM1]|nr:unnamed protein product [Phytomonas sp. EM1]|eukprot:CCW65274.1 unnamed protein product [Phytomonas sp. isolate EM1]
MWRRNPQLMPIVLSGACAAILSLFIVTVLFEGLRAICSLASWTSTLAAVVVCTQVVVQFLLKVAVSWGWVVIQYRLRKENQVLVWSECRFAPVSGAVGLGFGMTATWATGGVLFDAFRQLPHFSERAAAYDLDACPQLPLLVHSSLQCAMLTLCHVSWGIMTGQPAAALAQQGVRSYLRGLRRRLRPLYVPMRAVNVVDVTLEVDGGLHDAEQSENAREDAETNLGTEDSMSAVVADVAGTKSTPEALTTDLPPLMREEVEGGLRDRVESQERAPTMRPREGAPAHPLNVGLKQTVAATVGTTSDAATAANPFESSLYRYNGIIPMDTIFLSHLDFAFSSLVSAFILQTVFSMMSIVHSGALDIATGAEVTTRGCVVSLPIQLVVLTVSVLWALWTLREERVKID